MLQAIKPTHGRKTSFHPTGVDVRRVYRRQLGVSDLCGLDLCVAAVGLAFAARCARCCVPCCVPCCVSSVGIKVFVWQFLAIVFAFALAIVWPCLAHNLESVQQRTNPLPSIRSGLRVKRSQRIHQESPVYAGGRNLLLTRHARNERLAVARCADGKRRNKFGTAPSVWLLRRAARRRALHRLRFAENAEHVAG